jgi:hypothetical protein
MLGSGQPTVFAHALHARRFRAGRRLRGDFSRHGCCEMLGVESRAACPNFTYRPWDKKLSRESAGPVSIRRVTPQVKFGTRESQDQSI